LKVAALYDVHAMPHALGAVLDELADVDPDLVFGGDLIGGPFPHETVELARSVDGRFLRGNGEREPDAWDRAHLTPVVLAELARLPAEISLDGVLYCHAAPDSDLTLTTASTPVEALDRTFGGCVEGVVVIGHTHHQFDLAVGAHRIVNAGSVGMAYEDDVAAFWALVEDGTPLFRRTRFDVERAAAEIEASGWPGAAAFVAENLRATPSRAEAIEQFERLRAA